MNFNSISKILHKRKDKSMSLEDKYKIFSRLELGEISVTDIKYLSLSGYYKYTTYRPDEEYILIGSLLDHFEDKHYFNKERIGIWVSGVVYYRELIVENGKMIYREEIKP